MGNINIFVLIWKNFMLQIRHPLITVTELLIPIVLIVLLILSRRMAPIKYMEIETVFESYDINLLPDRYYNSSLPATIYYMPQSTFLNDIMERVSTFLNVSVRGFDTEGVLEQNYLSSTSTIAAVVFHPNLTNGLRSYEPIEFTVRPESIIGLSWNLSYAMSSYPLTEINDKTIYGTDYVNFGFLSIQHAVAKALMENVMNSVGETFDDRFTLEMCRQPYPPFTSDAFYKMPAHYVTLAICLGFLFPSVLIAKSIVHERHTKLKETLRLMGLSNWENWIAWFIKEFICFFLLSLIITALLHIKFGGPAVFNQSDPAPILLWLTLFSCDVIVFTFFITTFFDNEYSAVAAVCVLYIITFMPYIHSRGLFHQIPADVRFIFCLIPNTLFSYSVQTIVKLELLGKGLHWNTFGVAKSLELELSMDFVYLMLGINIIVYGILTWYSEGIHQKLPWYFPLLGAYWTNRKDIPFYSRISSKYQLGNSDFFEGDKAGVKPIINVKNLTKVYRKFSQPVINNVDLKAYKGQITVLLAHNCCGKTTFISMLYGAQVPTSGRIIIKEYDMCQSDDARKIIPLLGICPSYDVCIEELSIMENLFFFCCIKGYDVAGMRSEINHIMALFDLEIKKNRIVSTVSPNVKRLLSISIALIGDSEVVFLDEPTLSMDSNSRRITWDALILEKTSRAIFITTSHIKEADALGDRIAVLQDGQFKCCGSPLFLKKKYGAGYILTVVKEPECQSIAIKNMVFAKFPDAVVDETENELKFILPLDKCNLYHVLLKDLEEKDFNIKDIFLSETTLDKLYEKITDAQENKSGDTKELKSSKDVKKSSSFASITRERNEGCTLFCQQVMALLRKKHTFSSRNKRLTLSQIIIPPLIIALTSLMKEENALSAYIYNYDSTFSLKAFKGSHVVYGIDPISNVTIDLGDTYASLLSETEHLHLVDLEQENYLTHFVTEATKDLKSYKAKYIIGAVFEDDFNKTLITAFYNAEAYHAAPISLLYVHNTILSYYTKEESYKFIVKNHPLPYKDASYDLLSSSFDLSISFFWAQDFIIGLAFLMSSFVVFLVLEISSDFKKQQFISGVNSFVYWFSTYLYDFTIYIIPCILVLMVLSIYQIDCLSDGPEIGSLFLLLALHGLAALLFIYCCTICARCPSVAYMCVFLYYLFGLFLLFVVYSLEVSNRYSISESLNILFILFIPSYSVGRGIYNIHRNCMSNIICNNEKTYIMCMYKNATSYVAAACCLDDCGDTCLYWSESYMSLALTGIGKQLIILALQIFIFILILIVLEMHVFQNLTIFFKEKRIKYYDDSRSGTHKNVKEEENRILSSPVSQLIDEKYYVILKNASKFRSQFIVGKFSFGLKKGECFGLIGIDNSGKATVLRMISGTTHLSTGNIYVDGLNIMMYPQKVMDKIGFSFGKHALLKHQTVEETLTLFAKIRGIPDNEIPFVIKSLTYNLSLNHHLKVQNCNDIAKRKLCVAIAIIGIPPLIVLEEPTDEMNPAACTCTIETIKAAKSVGCTIILATQKMVDCEALCDHLGILIRGKLTFMGDFEHLKKDYQNGFTLILRVMKSRKARSRHTRRAISLKGSWEEIKAYIENSFPHAVAKIEFNTYLNYFMPRSEKFSWSKLFEILEKMKLKGLITTYSISETNPEHILSYNAHSSDYPKDKKITEFLKERKTAK